MKWMTSSLNPTYLAITWKLSDAYGRPPEPFNIAGNLSTVYGRLVLIIHFSLAPQAIHPHRWLGCSNRSLGLSEFPDYPQS